MLAVSTFDAVGGLIIGTIGAFGLALDLRRDRSHR